jgi:murein DD-endopeptidase MepM/ murein hydrolase activator NlpD
MSALIEKQKVSRRRSARRPAALPGTHLRPSRQVRRFVPSQLALAGSARPASPRLPVRQGRKRRPRARSGSLLPAQGSVQSFLQLQKPQRHFRLRIPQALRGRQPEQNRPSRRLRFGEHRKGVAKRFLQAVVSRRPSPVEIVLAATLLAGALAPAAFHASFVDSRSRDILLPESTDAESALFQYLVPEDMQGAGPTERHPEAVDTVRTRVYTVRSGDTISGIAQRFGLNMDTVISYNGIQDARALREGAVLTLPNADGLKYRVKRGDYLEGIARRQGVALNALLDWNNLESALIVPGQELFVPGARLSEMELNRVFGRLFIYPTTGRITSRFGIRNDPLTGLRRFHNGVDLANELGTPVVAAMSGRVAMLGYNPNFGKYIILSHPEGFQTLYGHLDEFLVRKGQQVRQGQGVARMGNTGYSTGSHLHFSIFRRGEPVDPFKYLH